MMYAFTPTAKHEAAAALACMRAGGWGIFNDDLGRRVLVAHGTAKGQIAAPRSVVSGADIVICCYPAAVSARTGVKVVARDVNAPVQVGISKRTGNVLVRV